MIMEQFDLFGNIVQEKGDLKRTFGANPFSIRNIGIERDEKYFEIAKKRIEQEKSQLKLF